MIDPITIATVAGSLVQVCGKLSGYIITYVNKTRTIDSNVEGLSQEIDSLSQVLVAMQQSFESNAINIATLEAGTGHEAAHWKNVRQSLNNCQNTLQSLAEVWEKINKVDSRIPGIPRPKKVVYMIMSEEQITIYKGQIAAFRQTISLSLQLLTVTSVMGAQAVQNNMDTRLDVLAKEWSALRRFLLKRMNIPPSVAEEDYAEENDRIMDNLVDCVNTAQKVVSEASTRSIGNPSIDGEIMTERRREVIVEWIPAPGIPEEETDFPTQEYPSSEPSESRSEGPPDDIFSTHPANETAATSTQFSTSPKEPTDDANFDLEAHLIDHWRKLGKQKYTQEQYAQAEGVLLKALRRAEKKFGVGTQFEGKDETLEILACTFVKQGKMDQVDELLSQYDTQFQGRDRTVQMVITAHIKASEWDKAESVLMKYTSNEKLDKGLESLANTCCQQGEWEFAEKLLLKHTEFNGRENMLEMLAMSCYKKRQWNEAETFLQEFLKDKNENNLRVLEAVHTLADVCLQKSELEAAEEFCRRAVEGRQRLLGGRNPLFHQSVYLLVEICYAKEDPIEAEGYAEFLPPSFQQCLELDRLFSMGPNEAAQKVGVELLKNLIRDDASFQKKWDELRNNIREEGLSYPGDGVFSLIHAFAEAGNSEALRLILRKGVDIETKDSRQRTAVYLAASNGQESAVQLLLEKGANVHAKSKSGRTVLHAAASKGHESICRLLLAAGANIEEGDAVDSTPLHLASASGHAHVVRLLLDHNANIEAKFDGDGTALHKAAELGFINVVRMLVKYGAYIEAADSEGCTPLMVAVGKNNEEMIKLLLELGANIEMKNMNGDAALYIAAFEGHYSVVNLLLMKRAKIDATNKNGHTPLFASVDKSHDAIVQLLLENGASVNIKTPFKAVTILGHAAFRGQEKIVRLLLAHGAKVNEFEGDGRTALHKAARHGNDIVARILLENGAFVDAKNEDGMTALHQAATHGKDHVIAVLLENGANPNARTNVGRTAAELAMAKGYMHCAEMCGRKKADVIIKVPGFADRLKNILPKGDKRKGKGKVNK